VIILLTTSCQASLDSEGWFNTWSAEWQARRQLRWLHVMILHQFLLS
jgi:hypothetical protein